MYDICEFSDDSFLPRGRFGPYPERDVYEAQRVLEDLVSQSRSIAISRLLRRAKGVEILSDVSEESGEESEGDYSADKPADDQQSKSMYALDSIYEADAVAEGSMLNSEGRKGVSSQVEDAGVDEKDRVIYSSNDTGKGSNVVEEELVSEVGNNDRRKQDGALQAAYAGGSQRKGLLGDHPGTEQVTCRIDLPKTRKRKIIPNDSVDSVAKNHPVDGPDGKKKKLKDVLDHTSSASSEGIQHVQSGMKKKGLLGDCPIGFNLSEYIQIENFGFKKMKLGLLGDHPESAIDKGGRVDNVENKVADDIDYHDGGKHKSLEGDHTKTVMEFDMPEAEDASNEGKRNSEDSLHFVSDRQGTKKRDDSKDCKSKKGSLHDQPSVGSNPAADVSVCNLSSNHSVERMEVTETVLNLNEKTSISNVSESTKIPLTSADMNDIVETNPPRSEGLNIHREGASTQKDRANKLKDGAIPQHKGADKLKEGANVQMVEANLQKKEPNSQKVERNTQNRVPVANKQKEGASSQKEETHKQKEGANSQKKEPYKQKEGANSQKEESCKQKEGANSQKEELCKQKEGANSQKKEPYKQKEGANSQKEELCKQKEGANSQKKEPYKQKDRSITQNKGANIRVQKESVNGQKEGANTKNAQKAQRRLFECKECDMNFLSLKALNNHLKGGQHKYKTALTKHHAESKKDQGSTLSDSSSFNEISQKCEKLNLSCSKCGVMYKKQRIFNHHTKMFAKRDHETMYLCSVCNYLTKERGTMEDHINSQNHGICHPSCCRKETGQ